MIGQIHPVEAPAARVGASPAASNLRFAQRYQTIVFCTCGGCRDHPSSAKREASASKKTVASHLTGFASDGIAANAPGLNALEAERGFAQGNGFLPGQMIDRVA